MRSRLREAWESRTSHERVIVTILVLTMAATLYGWLAHSGGQARLRLQAGVATLRAQAAGLELQAVEIERLRLAPLPPASPTNLRLLVETQIEEAGLSHALAKIDAPDTNQVVVAFGPVEFSAWITWVGGLKSQQVRLSACRIEALPAPGMVSVTATLLRTK